MDIQEMRAASPEDLQKELVQALEANFKLRMQKATGQLGQSHLLKARRRQIAQIKTILREKAGK